MRPAGEADRGWIERRLRSRLHEAMFPLANLCAHGWDGDAPRAIRFWLDRESDILVAVSLEGMLMPVAVGRDPAAVAQVLAEGLSGRPVIGCLGAAREVRPLLAALGLAGRPAKLDEDQPQLALALSALVVPDGPGRLTALSGIDRKVAVRWRAGYLEETLGEGAAEAEATAESDIARCLAADSHRALVVDGQPVSMTGFNAALPEIVQIGGVWTPPEARGLGHARRAVALHLAEARARGVGEATLFASGDAAVRAYRALGFRPRGRFSLVLFSDPEAIAPCAPPDPGIFPVT